MLVAADAATPITPCGGCRQKLREFAGGGAVPVWSADLRRVLARHTLAELLPRELRPRSAGAAMSNEAAQMLRATGRRPRIAVLLGSGWRRSRSAWTRCARPTRACRAFRRPASPATPANPLLGRIGAHEVAVLCGRRHAYEGGDVAAMKGAIDALAAAGVQTLVQTNAAGSPDETMRPGELDDGG